MGITTYVEPDIRTMIGSLLYSCRRACWISRIQFTHHDWGWNQIGLNTYDMWHDTLLLSYTIPCVIITSHTIFDHISSIYTHTHHACLSYPIWSVNKMCTCLHLLAYNCIRSTHIISVHVYYIQTFRRSPLRWPVTNNIFYTWTTHNQPVWHTIHRFIVLPSQPVLLLLLA